ncbi:unnamed protein product [Brachionus calyciflorus]|uniref:Uncharacterized protein n=1 Tax=Brachionus calyciflorus TaxID=104777 RepID=A0A813UIK1_9BILA|nr:unnamed protein product [Brachionus calyciflorus]
MLYNTPIKCVNLEIKSIHKQVNGYFSPFINVVRDDFEDEKCTIYSLEDSLESNESNVSNLSFSSDFKIDYNLILNKILLNKLTFSTPIRGNSQKLSRSLFQEDILNIRELGLYRSPNNSPNIDEDEKYLNEFIDECYNQIKSDDGDEFDLDIDELKKFSNQIISFKNPLKQETQKLQQRLMPKIDEEEFLKNGKIRSKVIIPMTKTALLRAKKFK